MNEVIHRRVCFLQALRNGKGNASVRQILRSLVVQYKGMRQHETHQAEAHYWAEKTFSNCISSATYRYGEFVVCFDEILHSSHHFPGRFKHLNEYMGEESNSQTKTSLFHGFQLVMSELIGFEGICVTMTDTHFTMFDVIEDNAGSPLNQRLIPWADLHYFFGDSFASFSLVLMNGATTLKALCSFSKGGHIISSNTCLPNWWIFVKRVNLLMKLRFLILFSEQIYLW